MSNRIREEFLQEKEQVRLNKYLSEAGVCSRREADRLIENGKVTVDGQTAQTGMKITPGQVVRVGKKIVSRQDDMVVLVVNKPRGIVCTEEKKGRETASSVSWTIRSALPTSEGSTKSPADFC